MTRKRCSDSHRSRKGPSLFSRPAGSEGSLAHLGREGAAPGGPALSTESCSLKWSAACCLRRAGFAVSTAASGDAPCPAAVPASFRMLALIDFLRSVRDPHIFFSC